jgi:hypothetical protein
MHCFPAESLSASKNTQWAYYMVDADFDRPVQFDKEQWAYDIWCRLDSFGRATCQSQREIIGETPTATKITTRRTPLCITR